MLLKPGIRVPLAAALAHAGQLQLCMGTETAFDEAGWKEFYVPDARLPKGPWRSPAPEEIACLVDGATDAAPSETLEILSLTTATASVRARAALKLGYEIATSSGAATADLWEALGRSSTDLLRAVTSHGKAFRLASEVRIGCNDPGLATTTRDPSQENRLLGLHVDSQERRALSDRVACQRLLSVNIAAEPRWFLFVNVSLRSVALHLKEAGGKDVGRLNGTGAGRAFLAGQVEYPVFRIRLEPGQGYLGPVQNMVHDGSTAGTHLLGLRASAFGDYSA